jgi:ribA/ribD-fused uncharacterized protein
MAQKKSSPECILRFAGKYEFLSNFFPCRLSMDGITYPSAEHAFQAHKSTDNDVRRECSLLPTPGAAKRFGQRTIVLRPKWEGIKVDVMRRILRVKFKNAVLRRELIDTYPAKLVEGNTWGDRFWGVCNGVGQNMMGKLLMEIRDELVS